MEAYKVVHRSGLPVMRQRRKTTAVKTIDGTGGRKRGKETTQEQRDNIKDEEMRVAGRW